MAISAIIGQVAAAILAAPTVVTGNSGPSAAVLSVTTRMVADDVVVHRDTTPLPPREWFLGFSGKLRARFVSMLHPSPGAQLVQRFFGSAASAIPGLYPMPDSTVGGPYTFVTMLPFTTKSHGRVGSYRVGWWPAEKHRLRSTAYANPDGFIEVPEEAADMQVSEHFRLRDFLTHDQDDVWPKYLVLKEALVDKLELILDDLAHHGHPNVKLVVLSGFRSPQYNAQGVGKRGGRARDSRHQFGDAADIYVDDGSGRMADLDGDGHVTTQDVRILLASVDRIEAAHPELVGGAGVYRATGIHGPFLHVDVRGEPARWGLYKEPLPRPVPRRKIHHGGPLPSAQHASGTTGSRPPVPPQSHSGS